MNKEVRNRLTVDSLLNTFYLLYKAKLDLNVMIGALFVLLEVNRQKLILLGVDQRGDNTGIAEEKEDDKIVLVYEIIQNAGPARTFFLKNGKKDEANKLKFEPSYLKNMDAEGLKQTGIGMVNDLTKDLVYIGPSGVTALTLGKVTEAIEIFDTEIGKPLEKIKSKGQITSKITITDRANQVVLNQLKDAMKFYITSDADMYNEFKSNCKAPKIGVRKATGPRVAKFEVTVEAIHDLTLEPIFEAIVKFANVRGNFITDVNGMIKAKLALGPQLGKIVAVDFINQSFVFTQTEAGYSIIIRMVPTGV